MKSSLAPIFLALVFVAGPAEAQSAAGDGYRFDQARAPGTSDSRDDVDSGLVDGVRYEGDLQNGVVRFYDQNDRLLAEYSHKNGAFDGTQKYYYFDGTLSKTAQYDDGSLNGFVNEFYLSGFLKRQEIFDRGELLSRYEYSESMRMLPKEKMIFGFMPSPLMTRSHWLFILLAVAAGIVIAKLVELPHYFRYTENTTDVPAQRNGTDGPSAAGPDAEAFDRYNPIMDNNAWLFRHLVETVQSGIFLTDTNSCIVYANHTLAKTFGFNTKSEIVGQNLDDDFCADNPEQERFLNKVKVTGMVENFEFNYTKKDGTKGIFVLSGNTVRNSEGIFIGVEGIVREVTAQRHLESMVLFEKQKLELILKFYEQIDSLRDYEELLDYIVDSTVRILDSQRCSIMTYDDNNKTLRIARAFGLDEEVIKNTQVGLNDPIAGDVARSGKALWVKNIEYDKQHGRPKGSSYLGRSFMIAPLTVEDKLIGVINLADKHSRVNPAEPFDEIDFRIFQTLAAKIAVAVENVKLYEELNIQTVTDPITQIYNHRRLSESLDHEIRRAGRLHNPLSLMMMDIDDFKTYNDSFGHLAGDELLKSFGQVLKDNVRNTDIVCRYAGDEFCIVFPDTDAEGVKSLAQKIKNVLASSQFRRVVTTSMGIAQFEPGMTKKQLIQKADQALYQSKQKGKNQINISG